MALFGYAQCPKLTCSLCKLIELYPYSLTLVAKSPWRLYATSAPALYCAPIRTNKQIKQNNNPKHHNQQQQKKSSIFAYFTPL